jgi:glyoxylase-like metal-dependent hydrolase (beta-lactamase superfamily II)
MKEIVKNIYMEDAYPGVMLVAIVREEGTFLIDSPLRPDDGRSWQSVIYGIGKNPNKLLVNLDSHPDRMLGDRAMECTVIAQAQTHEIAKERSTIFKSQNFEYGAEWEICGGLSGIRWQYPHLFFSEHLILNWDNDIIMEHHPGPESGACWVILPNEKLVFIGDAVVVDEPPYLAFANIPEWVDSLELLLSKDFEGYRIFSSRSGEVDHDQIKEFRNYLKDIHKRIEKLAKREVDSEDTEKLVSRYMPKEVEDQTFEALFTKRLKVGLFEYYQNHYVEQEQE